MNKKRWRRVAHIVLHTRKRDSHFESINSADKNEFAWKFIESAIGISYFSRKKNRISRGLSVCLCDDSGTEKRAERVYVCGVALPLPPNSVVRESFQRFSCVSSSSLLSHHESRSADKDLFSIFRTEQMINLPLSCETQVESTGTGHFEKPDTIIGLRILFSISLHLFAAATRRHDEKI